MMFSRSEKSHDTKPAPADILPTGVPAAAMRPTRGPSIISAELKVVGSLVCTGDLQIDGAVDGDVESRSLTIGENARVKGATTAESVSISGAVHGAVRGTTVRLSRTARVTGDITYKALSMEEGAVLNGNCNHDSKAEAATAAATTVAPTSTYRQPQAVAAGSASQIGRS